MAFINLSSSNKNFSFELNKNPKSGLQAQELKEGALFGFFSKKAKHFNLYFQDNPLKCSFNEELINRGDIEYNDLERYTSPTCYLAMLDKGISIKENKSSEKEEHTYSITLQALKLPGRNLINLFSKDLQGRVEILAEELTTSSRFFKITFSNKDTSIYTLLQVAKIFLLLAIQFSDRDARLEDAQIEKYLKEIVKLDFNYQLRNLFKVRFLTPNLFKKNKDLFNVSAKAQLDFQCNNNFMQRRDFIVEEAITDYRNANIVDLGCGEGNYVKILYKKLLVNNPNKESFSYTAIDSSEEALEDIRHLARKNEFDLNIFNSLDVFIEEKIKENSNKKYTIVCTEVIEHNTEEDAKKLLQKLNQLPSEKIIITTPNKSFNTFYNLLDDESRHVDHKYEVTEEEFKNLITENFVGKSLKFVSLGDKVNGIPSTLGVIVS